MLAWNRPVLRALCLTMLLAPLHLGGGCEDPPPPPEPCPEPEEGEPLPPVPCVVASDVRLTVSRNDGTYRIEVRPGEATITFSCAVAVDASISCTETDRNGLDYWNIAIMPTPSLEVDEDGEPTGEDLILSFERVTPNVEELEEEMALAELAKTEGPDMLTLNIDFDGADPTNTSFNAERSLTEDEEGCPLAVCVLPVSAVIAI